MLPKIVVKKKTTTVDAVVVPNLNINTVGQVEPARVQEQKQEQKQAQSGEFKLTAKDSLRYFNGLVFTSTNKDKSLFAIFDMDGTLIKTKSGKDFALNADDWEWLSPNVPDILADYSKKGYNIVIMTNQKGVSQGKTDLTELESKLGKIRTMLLERGVSISVLMATENDHYRKPLTGMWDVLLEMSGFSDGKMVNCKDSFYCGDAAGRPKDWTSNSITGGFSLGKITSASTTPTSSNDKGKEKKKSHNKADISNTDRDFAFNIGIRFCTPEALFLGQTECTLYKSTYHELNLVEYVRTYKNYPNLVIQPNANGHQEMVVLVGPPASGKSHVAKRYTRLGYEIINMDTLKTKAKCLKAAEAAIAAGKNIVIDNTNPDPESRVPYMQLANKYSTTEKPIATKAIIMNTPMDLVHHLNGYRVQSSQGKAEYIPIIAYRVYNKKYVKPSIDEGFTIIDEMPFVPHFTSELNERQFFYHYPTF